MKWQVEGGGQPITHVNELGCMKRGSTAGELGFRQMMTSLAVRAEADDVDPLDLSIQAMLLGLRVGMIDPGLADDMLTAASMTAAEREQHRTLTQRVLARARARQN